MSAVTKIDLLSEQRELYVPGREPVLVDVPEMPFLMIDGHGDPNVEESYRGAIEALYSVSYTVKFALKRGAVGRDYKVMPLEGLWSAPDIDAFVQGRKSEWDWTMMVRQPPELDAKLVARSMAEVFAKKGLAAVELLRMERFAEGRAAQLLYLGPYSQEGPAIARLHEFIRARGLAPAGRHHEIYLGDPRRSAPEKLRTVIRQPVAG